MSVLCFFFVLGVGNIARSWGEDCTVDRGAVGSAVKRTKDTVMKTNFRSVELFAKH